MNFKFNFNLEAFESEEEEEKKEDPVVDEIAEDLKKVAISVNQEYKQPYNEGTSKQEKKKPKINKEPNQYVSKAKKEDIDEDPREIINMIFIGHVDAGKSTIGGHLLLLTGQVDQRTMEKYEREAKEKNRESWYLSWALDTNTEERDKGKTVEVGKAYLETKNKRIVLLDAPGHKGFVPNMISGTAQADIAVLVISARKGEFETGFERGGQTREHALIAKIAGAKFLLILINKMDDSTVKWDKLRYDEICAKLQPYLRRIGFKPNEIHFMPCSGFTGQNLKDRVDSSICNWFNGPSFLDYLDSMPQINNKLNAPARLMVSDRYKDMGTVIICKVMSGFLAKGDSFVIMPLKKNTKVAALLSMDDDEKTIAKVGENIKVRLTNVEENDIPPGSIACNPNDLCKTANVIVAQLMILDCKSIICPGYQSIAHIHNAVEDVTLLKIIHHIDKKTGEKTQGSTHFVKADQICVARLKLSNSVCIAEFSDCPELGRFTLRDEGRTVAVGKIIKILTPKCEKSTPV